MKILVALANFGTKNDGYARRLIAEYRSMPYHVDLVLLTNIPKPWAKGVEVRVGLPSPNPWSLPFAHKALFSERRTVYDLYIYSEDDTLIGKRHIEAFLAATALLPPTEIAGFLRSERDAHGNCYISSIHSHFSWDPASVHAAGGRTFAYFNNEHAAAFILTRDQLARAIASGGFLVAPHEGRYDLLCTAATDPYTQCGFRKVIDISAIDDFIVEHLPNVYLGRFGLPRADLDAQVAALHAIGRGELPRTRNFPTESRVRHARWSKLYHEPGDDALVALVPPETKNLLSVGCGQGRTEEALIARGVRVVGIPLDAVIAACAHRRGVEVIPGDLRQAEAHLEGKRFDAIYFGNLLHLLPDPPSVLARFRRLLVPGGAVLATLPNLGYLPFRLRRLRGVDGYGELGSFERTGIHLTDAALVRSWFQSAGLRVERLDGPIPARFRWLGRSLLGLGDRALWERLLVLGRNEAP